MVMPLKTDSERNVHSHHFNVTHGDSYIRPGFSENPATRAGWTNAGLRMTGIRFFLEEQPE